jgi:DNA polymerase-1
MPTTGIQNYSTPGGPPVGMPSNRILTAPPGYTLMEFDASGQEFRWMAVAAQDPVMLQLCEPGEDPHSYMGGRIDNLDYKTLMQAVKAGNDNANSTRQLGKVANFSLQYRTSARKLRSVARVDYDIPMELPTAQRIHKTYQETYRRVPVYWGQQIALTKQQGYVETFAGRRVQVLGDWSGKLEWSMGSTAINYRIQGTGADQKYLALSVLRPYLTKIGARFAWDLHDGIYFWVPDDKVARATVEIRHLLNNLPYQRAWGFTPPIAMPWDCKTGYSWGTLRSYKYA